MNRAALKLAFISLLCLLLFQNCSPAKFTAASRSAEQASLGDAPSPSDDLPGDDHNLPPARPGDDGNRPQDLPDSPPPSGDQCQDRYADTLATHTPHSLCSSATTVRFMAGQHYYVGDISVAIQEGHLKVQIALFGNVIMRESHVDLAASPEALETSPGQFKYNKNYATAVSQYTYSLPLTETSFHLGQTIYARVHAAVEPGQDAILCGGETAWAEGTRNGIGWSMYFPITLRECEGTP